MERVISTRLTADVNGYVNNVDRATQSTRTFNREAQHGAMQTSQAMRTLGVAMAAAGAAIIAVYVKSTREAIAFEAALTKSVTQIGISREEMDRMGQAALRMGDTGRGPLELADSLFFVQSAGLRGSLALETVEASARAAAIGLGDTSLVADLATSAMNAYGSETLSASAATDVMVATVREGKASAEELTGAMGRILPIASEMGVSFDEVGAATAAMTRTGTNAATATTQLRAILTSLLNPAQQSERALAGIGLSSEMLRDTIREDGLWNALMMLREAIGDNDAVLGQVIPNVRALAGFLDLTGANAEENAQIFERMTDTVGLTDEAFEEWGNTAEAAQARFSAAMESARITLGQGLLPAVSSLMEGTTELIQKFMDLPPHMQTVVSVGGALVGIALVLGGGFLLLAPRILATRAALAALATTAPRATAALSVLGRVGGGALLAVTAIAMAFEFAGRSSGDLVQGVNEVMVSLDRLSRGRTDEFITNLRDSWDSLDNTIKILGVRLSTELGSGFGAGTKASNEFKDAVESLDAAMAVMVQEGSITNTKDAIDLLMEATGRSKAEVEELIKSMPLLRDALAGAGQAAEETADMIDPLEERLLELGERFGHVGENAAQAAQEMLDSWAGASGSFIDLLGAHTEVFDRMMAKEQEAAEKAAVAAGKGAEAWEDFAGNVEISIGQVIEELDKQIAAQAEWAENLAILTARGVDAVLYDYLVRLGPEGAGLVKAFADATEEEFLEAQGKWITATGDGMTGVAQRLAEAEPVLRRIADTLGQEVALNIALGMAARGTTVEEEAHQQGINIDRALSQYGEVEITTELNQRSLQQVGRSLDDLARDRTMNVTARLVAQASVSGSSQGINVGQRRGGPTGLDLDPSHHREHGGPVTRGQPYIVGERRPELFVPEQDGYIVPRVPPWWMARGGFGYTQNILLKDNIDATDFLNLLQAASARAAAPLIGSGRVLPAGSYRIGRGSAAHGYGALDLPAPTGTPVYAVAAGIVARALRMATSYGVHTFINHAAGRQSRYAHLSALYVRAGQEVMRGQLIGRVGSTGNSTGPHLHYEDLVNGVRRRPETLGIFDQGGIWRSGTLGLNASGGDEMVLPEWATRILMDLANVTSRTVGGDGASALGMTRGPMVIENHIEIGGEVVRVVRTQISEHDQELKERLRGRAGSVRR